MRYFHSLPNGRYRKKLIYSLHQDEGLIEGHDNLKAYIMKYYKNLFGQPEDDNFSLDESRMDDGAQVSDQQNAHLTAPYSEEEVK